MSKIYVFYFFGIFFFLPRYQYDILDDVERKNRMGKIYYIMGKSATGKDHIYRALLKDETLGLAPLILFTTRPMRRGETDGREYHFIDITEV